jgi:hypothetical protein
MSMPLHVQLKFGWGVASVMHVARHLPRDIGSSSMGTPPPPTMLHGPVGVMSVWFQRQLRFGCCPRLAAQLFPQSALLSVSLTMGTPAPPSIAHVPGPSSAVAAGAVLEVGSVPAGVGAPVVGAVARAGSTWGASDRSEYALPHAGSITVAMRRKCRWTPPRSAGDIFPFLSACFAFRKEEASDLADRRAHDLA